MSFQSYKGTRNLFLKILNKWMKIDTIILYCNLNITITEI